ncbi:LysR family transcriptional regulator [Halomicronema hongdechloris C2206]|uniref:LysR family transcriptional regulator n=1 Tax=Halomicronema hongdechloris C2206 TaxID=1641165 RepID=A0A1Z3HJM3_9CYAN|nr:LysR family transcriptional regulator [Halomicronema hongdechloris]ASC70524.1 LysR family transcriptional regulator [Halomicronema hongdechloris C2206]
MNPERLKYFITVAETGSFTKAAECLFITQPSLSVGIKKLEEEFGVRLFERGKKRVLLTQAGKLFLNKAKTIIREYESARQEIKKECESYNLLRIGIFDTISVTYLTELISEFIKFNPGVKIEQLNDSSVPKLKSLLDKGEIDLIICVLQDNEIKSSSSTLFQEEYLLAVAKDHPLAERKSVSLEVLNNYSYIDRSECEIRNQLQELFASKNICPKIIYQSPSDEWTKALVAAGIGLAIMPCQKQVGSIIKYLHLSDLHLSRKVGLVWRSEQRSEIVSRFQSFLASRSPAISF